MFYSDVILSKRGPLARVWLAAHWERKLSKSQFLQTSIEKSVSAIMGQEVVPMALRLSGQLLLGVVRIYSRKAKYLLEDCNEALLKIKMAFKSGAVDMTNDQLNVARSTITLQDTRTDFDILLPDPALENWDIDLSKSTAKKARGKASEGGGPGAHTARAADITLPHVDYGAFDDTGLDYESAGIGTQDFDPDGGLDLGLEDDLLEMGRRDEQGRLVDENGDPVREGLGLEDDSMSIGVGRDAPSEAGRQSVGSLLDLNLGGDITMGSERGGGSAREGSVGLQGFDGGLDLGLENDDDEPLDLGLDTEGQPMDLDAEVGVGMGQRLARSVTPEPGQDSLALALADMTPKTAARIRDMAEKTQQEKEASNKQTKAKKQIIDTLTELPESQLGGPDAARGGANLEGLLTEERYLPRSRAYLRLLSIRQDPTSHFLPFADSSNKDKASIFAGPMGLAPELSELFTFDIGSLRKRRTSDEDEADDEDDARTSKRARQEDEDQLSEVGRRGDAAELSRDLGLGGLDGNDLNDFNDTTIGAGGFDIPPLEEGLDVGGGLNLDESGLRRSSRRSKGGLGDLDMGDEDEDQVVGLPPLSRLSTPDGDDAPPGDLTDSMTPSSSNPLAAFDVKPAEDKVGVELAGIVAGQEENEATRQGWSKNTVRAIRVVRHQLSEEREAGKQGAADDVAERETAVVEDDGVKKISFKKISQNATRRAAAGFFFEMLVLGTKDCVKLKQERPYGDILVGAKEKLWKNSNSSTTTATAVAVATEDASAQAASSS